MPDGARELDPKIADLLDPELARLVQPFDRHNQTLIQNVHPTQWLNPEPAGRYHLVVLGAGTGGLVSAAGAAGLGARVALVERRMMGGDCLNYGCVPSKALISAARAWHKARAGAEAFGAPRHSGAPMRSAAPVSISTLCPWATASRTLAGIKPTRYS